MKTKQLLVTACLALAAIGAWAQSASVTNVCSITATASVQDTNNDNGTVTSTGSPLSYTIGTKQILAALAIDENAEGNYGSSTFPTGAKLVAVSGNSGPDFQVVDKNDNLLVDVSDIVAGSNTGVYGSDVSSGKQNDGTGLASPTWTDLKVFTFTFDDSNVSGGVGLQFALSGVMKNVTTDTTPNVNTGIYKETQSHTVSGGSGDGNLLNTIGKINAGALTVTGSFSASGSGPGQD